MMHIPTGTRMTLLLLSAAGLFLLITAACTLPVASVSLITATPAAHPTTPPQVPTATSAAAATSAPAATLPPQATHTTAPQPPASTATNASPDSPQVSEVQIYVVALEDAGKSGTAVGCGDSLVSVKRAVDPTRQPITAALNELFKIKDQFIGQSGLYNALWQSNLHVASAEVDASGTATVTLSGQVMMGGECDTPRFKGQIEQTILSVGGVRSANIFLNGKPIDQALSLK